MLIEEHLRGVIYIPIVSGDSYTVIEHSFTEDDVVQGSCSIISRCCDDSTFTVGGVRPAELAIKLRIELPEVNAYTLYGAKIRLYSIYSSAENAEEVLRGEFWVTSADRTKTVYTIKASDAIVWLDSGAYTDSTQQEADNPIYQYCSSSVRAIDSHLRDGIMPYINSQLAACGIDEIMYDIRSDITNNFPDGFSYALLPVDAAGSCGSRSPRDYVAYLAQIAAGCVQMMTDPDNPDIRKLYLTPYGYQPTADCSEKFRTAWENAVSIPYDSIALDECDIADYVLYIHKTYIKTYDETGWSSGGAYSKYMGNIVIDITGNPFLDGRWHQGAGLGKNPFAVLNGIGDQLGKCTKRPFRVRCHPQFACLSSYPKLGQRIRIEEKPDIWKESIITKMVWRFRGGWEFGCAGKDSRLLSQAAKKSLAKHSEEAAKTYAAIGANAARAAANDAMAHAQSVADGLNDTIDTYNNNFEGIWRRLDALENT